LIAAAGIKSQNYLLFCGVDSGNFGPGTRRRFHFFDGGIGDFGDWFRGGICINLVVICIYGSVYIFIHGSSVSLLHINRLGWFWFSRQSINDDENSYY